MLPARRARARRQTKPVRISQNIVDISTTQIAYQIKSLVPEQNDSLEVIVVVDVQLDHRLRDDDGRSVPLVVVVRRRLAAVLDGCSVDLVLHFEIV